MSQNARIAENAVSAESLATRPRVTFATGLQYNSSVFLAFTIGSTLYNILAFYTFAFATENSLIRGTSFIFASISIASHALSILTLWTIWAVKPDNTKRSFYPAAVKHLPIVQSLFPLLISFALLFRLVATLIVGDCSKFNQSPMMFASFCDPYRSDGGITLRLVVELMFNPILTAFLLRDTPSWALIASWAVAVVIMVTLAIVLQSTDIGVTTAAYVFCSVLVYVDSTRHYKGLMDKLAQLQKTLVDNPLTSFLNGLECILEVLLSWEAQDQLSIPQASAKQDPFTATNPALPTSPTALAPQYLARTRSNRGAIQKVAISLKSTISFMTMTINCCLDYAKTNAGVPLVPKLEPVYLKALLEMPTKMMRELLAYRQIVLHSLSSVTCSHIVTDKQWLLENLLCLLSNAVKYSVYGPVDVSVTLVQSPQERPQPEATEAPQRVQSTTGVGTQAATDDRPAPEYLRFEVLDTGIGLSEEAMQTLFNPFKQAQRMAGGTGLGLFSLAKRVEALHGLYGVSRRPDGAQGSLFWFSIPYRPDPLTAALNSESSAESSTIFSISDDERLGADASPLEGPAQYRVLVVDDAPLIVRMTTMLLTSKGHRVDQAVNGADALEKILDGYAAARAQDGGTPYDVVLMDLQMPVMDGNLATRRLRAEEARMLQEALEEGRVQGQLPRSAGTAESEGTEPAWHSTRPAGDGADHQPQLLYEEYNEAAVEDGRRTSRSSTGSSVGEGYASRVVYDSEPEPESESEPEPAPGSEPESERDIERGLSARLQLHHPADVPDTHASQELQEGHAKRNRGSDKGRDKGRHGYHQLVIAVSASSDEETVQEALRSGADAFMTKPFSYATFTELMRQHCARQQTGF